MKFTYKDYTTPDLSKYLFGHQESTLKIILSGTKGDATIKFVQYWCPVCRGGNTSDENILAIWYFEDFKLAGKIYSKLVTLLSKLDFNVEIKE